MKYKAEVVVEVNGKRVVATVSVEAPGLDANDAVNAKMILGAVADGQNRSFASRHHKDRVARVMVDASAEVRTNSTSLRLVA